MKVLVAHPGIQHAHQLARALHGSERLAKLVTGVPLALKRNQWLSKTLSSMKLARETSIPRFLRSHYYGFPLLRKSTNLLLGSSLLAKRLNIQYHCWFDRMVASQLPVNACDVVVGYETSSREYFRSAKRCGMITVLDAASLHFAAQEQLGNLEIDGVRQLENSIKGEELLFADYVITASPMARSSYVAAGFPANRVFSVPLGADRPFFSGTDKIESLTCRFVFVGNLQPIKGIDLLLDAFSRLGSYGVNVSLTIVGSCANSEIRTRVQATPRVNYIGYRPYQEIPKILFQHDCLVLPSRFDGFGMVVAEAFANRTPVIVSKNVGASFVLDEYPDAGWLTDATVESLFDTMKRVAINPDLRIAAQQSALAASATFSWDAYAIRVNNVFDEINRSIEART